MPTIEPHRAREVAESFGVDAERYDRTRPSYPAAMIERIVAASPGRDVLDVGAGTGIAARQFAAAGCTVLGVEPDARMAEFARRGGLEVEVSTFEAWDPGDRRFDAVVAGQAWHWIDPDAGAAAAARVLRPGGRLAVFWNAFQPEPAAAEAFAAVYRRVLPDSPAAAAFAAAAPAAATAGGPYSVLCDRAADGIRASGAFGDPERWRHEWDVTYTRDAWLDQVPTFGGHTQLPAAVLAEVIDGFGAAIDGLGGGFATHYTTVVVTAARSGG
ncbi:class I SAM-dependent methyltransferase [Dactylosporangium aurantiacum]|uniref:Class I SAM-dependent methyltransferase n=1 Tax=Dactylosporangium aurantiacum TaxID=35754 RepID=A0A9Q9IRQ3_9ACTN|nr:class I SAM-dependent methyltransferase [Dactylosporangium aurantiacum]MDG6103293.1 class I SAM-dependent methyltransferase [Dactylosporangium aurantiacum]UWZ57793.1 class I SAM-dependent methyltransferase [Dactylosporangium aurantiacum]